MKLNKEYVIQDLGGLQIAACPQTSNMVRLSNSGAFIFSKLTDDITQEELLQALCDEYPDVHPGQLAADLKRFLGRLEEANLLSR